MTNIRLLPVVVLAIAALLVLKTVGLVTNGGYVLAGVGQAQAAGGGHAAPEAPAAPAGEPTMEDTSPTLTDAAPTLAAVAEPDPARGAEAGEGGMPPLVPIANIAASTYCRDADGNITPEGELVIKAASSSSSGHGEAPAPEPEPEPVPEGSFPPPMAPDCLPSGDVVPMRITPEGSTAPLNVAGSATATEQQVLERLAARREELAQYERDLAMRASIVTAAEQRIEERAATLAAMEAQISALVDQRTEMEAGQFTGIVAMYEAMKPKDAARIFNNLEMEVLLRVAKTMSPRKMAPILAEMEPPRAQELTVKMAALADKPATEMTPDDLAALPQIVGQ